jgi:hypothetical protein
MATITLTKVFINNMSTGQYVAAQSAPDRARTLASEGEVRTYGQGRRRGVSHVGRMNTMDVTLRYVHELSIIALESWIGDYVLYRDDRGRRFTCVYYSLGYKEYRDQKQYYDVDLTLHEVSFWEPVAE